jgi:hypothetical protein
VLRNRWHGQCGGTRATRAAEPARHPGARARRSREDSGRALSGARARHEQCGFARATPVRAAEARAAARAWIARREPLRRATQAAAPPRHPGARGGGGGTEAELDAVSDEERMLGEPLLDDAWEAAACRCSAGIRSEGQRQRARNGRVLDGGWARTAYEENEPLLGYGSEAGGQKGAATG